MVLIQPGFVYGRLRSCGISTKFYRAVTRDLFRLRKGIFSQWVDLNAIDKCAMGGPLGSFCCGLDRYGSSDIIHDAI